MRYFYIFLTLLGVGLQITAFAQDRISVTGIVIDGDSNGKTPLPGASISLDGKVVGQADNDGRFRVTAPANGQLSVSFISYLTKVVKINGRTNLGNIVLEGETNNLKEVKVTQGYITKTRELSTGSSVKISGKELQGQPAGDVMSLLQGKVAGLNIQNNTGAPGMRGSVTIRGISNINISGSGNEMFLTPTSPLYVIDGVPVDDNQNYSYGFQQAGPNVSPASQIPAEDIESVEVLKDAAATALYGSRGAYGVIIITTKRGNSKVPVVRYSGQAFMSAVPQLRATIGGRDERMLRLNEIIQNDTAYYHAINTISNTPFLSDSLNPYYNNSTNWQSYFYKPTYNQNHNINIQGGDVKFNYKAALGVYDETGIQQNTGYSRYNLNLNMLYNPSRKFRLTAYLYNSIQKQQTGSGNGLINNGAATTANTSSLLPAPSLFSSVNAVLAALATENDGKVLNTSANTQLEYEIVPNLKATAVMSISNVTSTKDNFTPAILNGNQANNYLFNGSSTDLYGRGQLQYVFSLKEKGEDAHNFNFFGFAEMRRVNSQNDVILDQTVVNDQLRGPLVNMTDYVTSLGGTLDDFRDMRTLGFAGQFSYNYKQKYVFDFNYRTDGTSANGPNQPFVRNPSFALKWNFNREKWFDNAKWLNYGAIRLSYGSNIAPQGTIYDANGKYTGGIRYNNLNTVVLNLDRLPNVDLVPTKNTTYNAGFDFGILDNRLSGTFDTYYKQVDNSFSYRQLSTGTGFATVANTAISNVNYGWEVMLTGRPLPAGSPFDWSISANFAINREILAKLPDGLREMLIDDTSISDQDILYRLGTNSLSNYLYNTKGVYSDDNSVQVDPLTGLPLRVGGTANILNYFRGGDPRFTDLNGDYVIDASDKLIAGNSQPVIVGGFNSLLRWKQWSLEVNGSFTLDRDIINNPLAIQLSNYNNPGSLGALVPLTLYDYWKTSGNISQYANPFDYVRSSIISPFRYSQTVFQEDGSYLKINAIKLYYNFNQSFTRKFGMNRVSVNATASNLAYFTRYSGPNPEQVSALGRDFSSGYPIAKQFTLGLNIEF